MTEEQLKQFLKTNLELEVTERFGFHDGNAIVVRLKYDGEVITEDFVTLDD